MHEPGPPRFTTVGQSVQLAPHAPDPSARYGWRVVDAPADSEATVGDDAVVEFAPDVPGTYELELSAPDGEHPLTVRAFPDERRDVRFELPVEDALVDPEDDPEPIVHGPFNDHVIGPDRARLEGDRYVFEARLPPGEYLHYFVFEEDLEQQVRRYETVEGPGRPRVGVDARREGDEVVIEASPSAAPSSDFTDSEVDVEFYPDDRDDVSREDLVVEDAEARVPLDAVGDGLRVYAVPVAERHGFAESVEIERTDDGITVARPNDPPEWAADATVYEIFVRQFAGPNIQTTFERIADRLPYLEDLGVDTLWLTPVVDSETRHGYHIVDYFDTADDLGTREEFEELVEACHDRGIKVVFDLVINHTSADHPAFQMSAAGVDEYRDWYVWEDGEAEHFFNWTSIPNLNYESLGVREHMLDVVDEWASVVDGFRADVAWGVPHGFWKEVRERIREDRSEFLLLEESIPHDPSYQEGEFDMHYDTSLYYRLLDVGRGEEPAETLLDTPEEHADQGFPEQTLSLHYVENHDEDRYREICGREPLEAAVAATFTLPGVPMIYYGQERGMTEQRGPMEWRDGDDELTEFHRALVGAREDHPALSDGDLVETEWSVREGESESVVAFARAHEDESVVVALNFGDDAATVDLPAAADTRDLVTGRDVAAGESSDARVAVEDVVVLPAADR